MKIIQTLEAESSRTPIPVSRLIVFCSLFLALGSVARAAEPAQLARIGFLTNNSPTTFPAGDAAFRLGLRELGYIEGKNIIIEWRYAEGKPGRLREMLKELIRSNVAIVVTGGPSATRLAKQSNTTIPVVMATDPDPVANGFVASLARPGGNVTGLSTLAPEISGKQLEILKEVVPRLARVAVFGTSFSPGSKAQRGRACRGSSWSEVSIDRYISGQRCGTRFPKSR